MWFTLFAVHPVGPAALLWVTTPFCGPLVAVIFWRTSRAPGLLADNQRFWRRLTPAPILVGTAQSIQALEALRHPQADELRNTPAMLIFDGLALLVIIYALVRLPSGLPTARVRVLLDTSTVVLATAVFIWHFGTRQALQQVALDGRGIGGALLSLALVVMTLVVVFALARLVISQYQVLDGAGVRFLATGMFFGALAPMAEPLVQSLHESLHVLQVSIPLVFLAAAKAAAVQRDTVTRPQAQRQAQRRSFSLLPYSAVVAVDVLLLRVVFTDHADLGVVATAAVLLTAIVLVRQISSLLDNDRLLSQLDHAATHDALTGLPNRVLFQRRLAQALSSPAPGAAVSPVAVLLIDLDDFKEVNDTLGHEVGDLLLIAVTERLQDCIKPHDTIARLGGDEFVIVLHNAGPEAAEQTAARLVQSLHHPVRAGVHELPVRASIGIADAIIGEDASALLRRADIAMYAAKKDDGNGFQRHHGGMGSTGSDHNDLPVELREAIEDDQLFLLYQTAAPAHQPVRP